MLLEGRTVVSWGGADVGAQGLGWVRGLLRGSHALCPDLGASYLGSIL